MNASNPPAEAPTPTMGNNFWDNAAVFSGDGAVELTDLDDFAGASVRWDCADGAGAEGESALLSVFLRAIVDFLSDGFFIELPIWPEGSLLHHLTGRVMAFMAALAVAAITSGKASKTGFPALRP